MSDTLYAIVLAVFAGVVTVSAGVITIKLYRGGE